LDEICADASYTELARGLSKSEGHFMPERVSNQLSQRFIGSSAETQNVRNLIKKVAKTSATVLIQGESGTGKEVAAKLIHDLSFGKGSPFVPVNCGAIPADLLESELFGHEKGAFTGAVSFRKGRFELAEGGTLFLDEIGDMPFSMQVKLLRVLQERSFERVGGTKTVDCNVRIIAATHNSLEEKIKKNLFREDLFYRLSVFPIEIPPLRDRRTDVAVLVTSLLQSSKFEGKGALRFSDDAILQLENYNWPGNVRELSNLIERLLVLYPNQLITQEQLPSKYRLEPPPSMGEGPKNLQLDLLDRPPVDELFAEVQTLDTDGSSPLALAEPIDLKAHLAGIERDLIIAALNQTDWVAAHAAKWLKLQRTTLVEKMRKYQIDQ